MWHDFHRVKQILFDVWTTDNLHIWASLRDLELIAVWIHTALTIVNSSQQLYTELEEVVLRYKFLSTSLKQVQFLLDMGPDFQSNRKCCLAITAYNPEHPPMVYASDTHTRRPIGPARKQTKTSDSNYRHSTAWFLLYMKRPSAVAVTRASFVSGCLVAILTLHCPWAEPRAFLQLLSIFWGNTPSISEYLSELSLLYVYYVKPMPNP